MCVRVTVESASEYNSAVRHAKALGLEPVNHFANGAWQTSTSDGEHSVFIGGSSVELNWVGRTLFHMEIDGSELGVKPAPSNSVTNSGSLTVYFEEEN